MTLAPLVIGLVALVDQYFYHILKYFQHLDTVQQPSVLMIQVMI